MEERAAIWLSAWLISGRQKVYWYTGNAMRSSMARPTTVKRSSKVNKRRKDIYELV
jgi:hypothetical protein